MANFCKTIFRCLYLNICFNFLTFPGSKMRPRLINIKDLLILHKSTRFICLKLFEKNEYKSKEA